MSAGAFRCGHPKSPENTRHYKDDFDRPRTRCRECTKRRSRECKQRERDATPPAVRHDMWRKYRLPHQIDAARKRVAMLENEARRYGLNHLVQP